ncbi:MAG: TonB-dependent receptor [Kofleriaceae bacterium]
MLRLGLLLVVLPSIAAAQPVDAGGDAPTDAPPDAALDAAPPPPPTPPEPAPACTATLHGHVVEAGSHEPIAGASVRVGGHERGETDAQGRFALRDLCPGRTVVEVQRIDSKPTRRSISLQGNIALEFEVALLGTEVVEIHDKAPPPPDMRSTTVLSGEALERKRGKGFSEAIAEVPGVSQLRSATGMAKPIIRGQFGRRLLVLVDGVRHRAQEWGLEHAPEIDPFIAGKITVVRGAGGVRYGSDAIGGAVLIDPRDLRHDPGYAGEAHLIGASNGRGGAFSARVLAAPGQVPGFAWTAEGTIKRLASPSTPDYALDNTGVLEWGAGLTVGYEHGNFAHKISYRRYQAELGVCSCLRIGNAEEFFAQIMRGRPLGSENYDSDFGIDRSYQAVAHDSALARSQYAWGDVGTLTATYAFQHDLRREYDIVRQSTTGPQFKFRLMTHELEGLFEHKPIHLNEHWHLRGAIGVATMAQVHNYTGLTLVPDHASFAAGVYATERLVGDDYEVDAGVRYDFTTRAAKLERIDFLRLVRSEQLAEGACGDSDVDPVTCRSRFHTLTASLGGMRRLTDVVSLKLELSTASRAPNPDEQFLNGAAPTFPVLGLGKPDLRPETTYGSSMSVSVQAARVTAEASVYANLITDYIYFAPAIGDDGQPIFDVVSRGTFPRFITRPVDALFYGADGGIAVKPHPAFELGAQVSLVRAKNTRDDSYLVFVPSDRARAAVTYHPPDVGAFRNSFVTIDGTYVARQRRFDLLADFATPPPSYFLLGAELGTETAIAERTVKLALQGANLTDARYRDYTSLLRYFADEPGWQVWLRMSVFFDSSSQHKGPP